jgi:methylmalonyl-CoA/ethylmalonyl-CoA epimerase
VTEPQLSLNRIDHVGVVVDDLAEACAMLTERFGLEPTDTIDRDDLRAVFFPCGETRVELLEILEPEARKRRLGEGTARIEHIAFEVDDIAGTLAILEALGIESNGPVQQSAGRDTFWTEASTSDGVMYQFIAPPVDGSP